MFSTPSPCSRMLLSSMEEQPDEKQTPPWSQCACRRRCSSASTRMRRGSIADRRNTTWPCRPIAIRPPCNRSRPSPVICCAWPTGSRRCGVTSVAMEATGVYWIPVYEILEARGFEVRLVNARHVKNVPGRKSDVSDCEWLRELQQRRSAAREFSTRATPSWRCAPICGIGRRCWRPRGCTSSACRKPSCR